MSDIILPPLSVLLPLNANLDLKFAVLQAGPSYYDLPHGYRTIEQAQADGAVVMAYGVFLNKTLNFIGLGSALYALAGLYQYLSKDRIIKHMVKCPYCRKRIYEKVSGVCLLRPRVFLWVCVCVCVDLFPLLAAARSTHDGHPPKRKPVAAVLSLPQSHFLTVPESFCLLTLMIIVPALCQLY